MICGGVPFGLQDIAEDGFGQQTADRESPAYGSRVQVAVLEQAKSGEGTTGSLVGQHLTGTDVSELCEMALCRVSQHNGND